MHFILIILFSVVIILNSAIAETSKPTPYTVSTSPNPTNDEIYQLDNAILIKQANTLLKQAVSAFDQQIRAFFHIEVQLKQAKAATKKLQLTKTKPLSSLSATLDEIRQALENTAVRNEELQRLLQLQQNKQKMLERSKLQVENVLQALQALWVTLDQLDAYVLEAQLRVNDGNLSKKRRPKLLTESYIKTQRYKFKKQERLWKKRFIRVKNQAEKNLQQLAETKPIMAENKQQHQSLTEQYSRELKRQTLKKQYLAQQPAQLVQQLQQLESERIWFNGAFNLAHSHFKQSQVKIKKIQKTLAALKQPKSIDIINAQLDLQRGDEIAAGIPKLESILTYHGEHQTQLQALQKQLQIMVKQATNLNSKAMVLRQHLFQMEVLAKVLETLLKQGKLSKKSIPKSLRHSQLVASIEMLIKTINNAFTAKKQSIEQLTSLAKQLKKDKDIQKQAKKKLELLQTSHEILQQEEELNSKLTGLDVEQVLQYFQQNREALKLSKAQVEIARKKFTQTQSASFAAQGNFLVLEGPLVRKARDESLKEQQSIIANLYQLAGLQSPDLKIQFVASTKKQHNDDESLENIIANLQVQQGLLSAHIRINQQQQQRHEQLLAAKRAEIKQLEAYLKALNDLQGKSQHNYVYAVELQKRIGIGEIQGDTVPSDLADALHRKPLNKLKSELSTLLNQQVYLQQQLLLLEQPNPVPDQEIRKFEAILLLMVERMNSLQLGQKYHKDSQRHRATLSQTEIKALQQAALRRMETADSMAESFFSIFPSKPAESLTELLQDYYQEIILMEKKQVLYDAERDAINKAIKLAEQEQSGIDNLLLVIKQRIAQSKLLKEQALVQIKAQLQPQQSAYLFQQVIDKYEVKLPIPIPISDKDTAIKNAAKQIFFHHVQMLAAQKWLEFFQQKQSAVGLVQEIAQYNDQLARLDAEEKRLSRKLIYLQGEPITDKTQETMLAGDNFAGGEIGTIRSNRHQLRRQGANWAIIKLAIVLFSAILISVFISRMTALFIKRYQGIAENTKGKEKADRMSVLLPFVKITLLTLLWVITIIVALSSIGFDVGAILAGLGIGGFAIAMALKTTLSDMIGGINILVTQVFKVGDRIKVKGEEAIVQKIGLRYTRLSHFSFNYIMTVPNSLLIEAEIINASAHPGCTILTNVKLSILNTADKVKLALQLIETVIQEHEQAQFIWIKHDHFDGHAFVLRIHYDILKFKDRSWVESDINVGIVKQLQKHNIAFAHRIQSDYQIN